MLNHLKSYKNHMKPYKIIYYTSIVPLNNWEINHLNHVWMLPSKDLAWAWRRSIRTGETQRLGGTSTGTLPSGKHTKNDGKSQFLMGKLIINGHVQ
jgi:hypothetical protein